MSKLSEILEVPEGVEFTYPGSDRKYIVNGMYLQSPHKGDIWLTVTGTTDIYRMIEQPGLIKAISSNKYNLTDQQITAIKGRIAEGTPWASRDKNGARAFFLPAPPINVNGKFRTDNYNWTYSLEDNLYDFITYDNSPVYLPDLIEGSEEE